MTTHAYIAGAYVRGAPTSPRVIVRHADMFRAFADGVMADRGADGEAYLSHYVFGAEWQDHYYAHQHSVAGYAGPCCCRWLTLDIDRPDLADALTDACRLVAYVRDRYSIDDVAVWFSGAKGFHIAIELVHGPTPCAEFPRIARAYAEAIATAARVVIDSAIYDVAHIIRAPNTRHPRTGLFKRRIDADDLYRFDVDGIRRHAAHPAGDGLPAAAEAAAPQLAADWRDAEAHAARAAGARVARQTETAGAPDARAPRYFLDLLRFGVDPGARHQTLFRCAAWLTEQGAPPSLCSALLTEPGRDVGLSPTDVDRQIRCGIEHARRQRSATADPRPDPTADPDAFERWAIEHETDPLPPGALDFPFGAAAPVEPVEAEGGTP